MKFSYIYILALLIYCGVGNSYAQTAFEGKLELVAINKVNQETAHIIWSMKDGNHKLEIDSEMKGKHYPYILITGKGQAGMTMISEMNGQQQRYDVPLPVQANAPYTKVSATGKTAIIAGYHCIQYQFESVDEITSCFLTDELNVNLADLPPLMNGPLLSAIRNEQLNGFPLQVISTDINGKEMYRQEYISVQSSSLSLDDFRYNDVPKADQGNMNR